MRTNGLVFHCNDLSLVAEYKALFDFFSRIPDLICCISFYSGMIMIAYWKLTTHANMGNGTKLDEAKQKQNDRVCTHTHTSMPSFLTVHGRVL